MSRLIKKATEGMIYTNGKDYARVAFLYAGDSPDNWWEITEEEYKAKMAEQAAEDDAEVATDADYQSALRELGVKV